eukprot:CAMPEP_0168614284 /NCGR_PEP_ID=MMETSP0449_2-20121227/3893_1 /TAXON_ID=1082188 /ORGANISM="Strombidium rassoulzadegani, Strain ras09" /LENGTH=257 /DNA_ID=CAMNT_0008654955 /DNA_START=87 /DNA_END=860 /DNA_ORIENTATION=-
MSSVALAARPVASAAAPRRSAVSARAAPAAPLRLGRPQPMGGNCRRDSVVTRVAFDFEMPEFEEEDPSRYQWPNKEFVKETLEQFPDAGVADVEQALVLYKEAGYVWLDIRSDRLRDVGAVRNSIHVPFSFDKKRFVDGKMEVDVTINDNWLEQLHKKIPNKETCIMVADMDGRTHAIDALEMMFDDGYENIVGIKGGFKTWFRTFDYNLRRRVFGEYAENFSTYDRLGSGDSCGIHSSGAGFKNQDRLSGDFWDNF